MFLEIGLLMVAAKAAETLSVVDLPRVLYLLCDITVAVMPCVMKMPNIDKQEPNANRVIFLPSNASMFP